MKILVWILLAVYVLGVIMAYAWGGNLASALKWPITKFLGNSKRLPTVGIIA